MKNLSFLYILISGVLINHFFVFEAASRSVFSAASEKDLTDSEYQEIIQANINKRQVQCTGEITRYHPEVLDGEEINRKADEAAKTSLEQNAEKIEEFINDCKNRGIANGKRHSELISCEEFRPNSKAGHYDHVFRKAKDKFLKEAVKERNKAILEREREYLRDLLLPKREQARHKSQEAVSTYENMQNSDSSGERAQEIETEKNRAIDYLKEEWEIAYQVFRCYDSLESLTMFNDEYRDYYYTIQRKKLASYNDYESVRQSLGKLGYHLEPVTGVEEYTPGAGGLAPVTGGD